VAAAELVAMAVALFPPRRNGSGGAMCVQQCCQLDLVLIRSRL
jgi:hypothetical protein